MFLIEYQEGKFIDAERINYISLNGPITFTIDGENDMAFTVSEEAESLFLNNLQALNCNPTNMQARRNHINNPDTKY
jgi:hypothetical protein